ncbi:MULTISPECIES: sn-glycerol-3-phosphate ABC transporter permease UgpA [Salinivibrio]|uniref:sn-glycerol-3-phosphate transport system permease protein UgpA n=1 Tax=Salinivibrio siamensis TaxID=414286 RepID=A0ABX3KBQ4_9GAMM|nr:MULTISPECIES: sn-glycerol-3-phosphate ABC transporter permease UgpA [Salinivibrio]KKA45838.1 glycerol-3-phosphate transporter permease [Salinivibrio sp. KP-1]MPS31685.1 sn-glycerol-3-phosphate ABC transporter permease UgpA [Salinivibrio sp. VYel7]MPX90256.1 sn-glycerol-3-phosphate ABC transporter permease UgpA [Salinivibrio sp. VYel1]MPX93080.1 sn-glycerol-3-phosphate ABC transporter permease UgpA [Salinivibrio sp. VYel9]MPX95236.1 sn-glycerol-3-phosphate ABC transporter permease UgpA [Sali
MSNKPTFNHCAFPILLLAPQLLITFIFFIWPAAQAVWQSTLLEDPFGLSTEFVGGENFTELLGDTSYYRSFLTTLFFSFSVAGIALLSALVLAVMADRVIKGATGYKTLLVWPYAVAPAVAGVLWLFMFNPTVGVLAHALKAIGLDWNPFIHSGDAMTMVIIAATWKQISYNFLFFLAGLQSIPRSLVEAAAIDGAGPVKRFLTIIFPLLSPTSFFLLVVNLVYAFFETFGVIHAMTQGGPGQSTTTLVYKVYADGFVGLNMGSSAAQSVVLMILVGALTVIQFKYVEKKVAY